MVYQVQKFKDLKKLLKYSKKFGQVIVISVNLDVLSYLNVTFYLHRNTYILPRKPNDRPFYIGKNPNHPPVILNSYQT